MRNLEIDLLRTFAAVADTGSFTSAGKVVARTQSAVSVQIKRLEQIVGRKVLERSSRSLALTPAGAALLADARRMLELNDASLRRIAAPPMAGKVRLGVTEYFVPNQLPRILAAFAAAYPGVHLDVVMGLSNALRDDLAAGRLDMAIVRSSPARREDAIWSEPQFWVAAKEWVERAGAPLPLVALARPCVLREFALATFKRQRRPHRIALTGSSMASVQAAVLAGLGVSIVSASSILPGMRILANRRAFPDPGRLQVSILKSAGARTDIVAALEDIVQRTLGVVAASRMAA
jgi:DNA-binding transcriptional LysR family regulator